MTNLKFINIYLDGFRACHYHKLPRSECPYLVGTPAAGYWQKGYDYGNNLNKVLVTTFATGATV